VFVTNTKSWKKAVAAIAKREASKIIFVIIFMLGYPLFFNLNIDNPLVKYTKQAIYLFIKYRKSPETNRIYCRKSKIGSVFWS